MIGYIIHTVEHYRTVLERSKQLNLEISIMIRQNIKLTNFIF